jgi:hypothetical protein
MSLPKIQHPTFNVIVPSTNQNIRMRPFLVREEKILLMAQTSENPRDIIHALQQVVNNCVIDNLNIDNLTSFDIEYLFLKLRAKSVGNVIEMRYTDPEDGKQYNVQVNLDDVEIKHFEGHTNKVAITDTTGVILKYPKADMADSLRDDIDSEVELMFEIMRYCMDKFYNAENTYEMADYSKEEVTEFINNLDVDTFKHIQQFMETMPKLYHEVTYKTSEGVEKTVVLQTLNDFFTLR